MSNERALREALQRIQYKAVSLADAQVIALEALASQTTSPAAASAPAVPQGWRIFRTHDGIDVHAPDGSACYVESKSTADRRIPEEVLHALCSAMLASAPSQPAVPQGEPVALREVGLTRNTAGMCVVTINGREAIRDNGDIISHFATLDWFAAPSQEPAVPEIDYQALIRAAYAKDNKWAQGTNGCIAFARGAEWFRAQMLAALREKERA